MNINIDNIDFEKANGLVTAVIQDADSGTVLMVGYQNREACARSLQSGNVTFWSRTKKRLWMKGESSGNVLAIKNVMIDCDNDALLYAVKAPRATCHKNSFSCFGERQTFDVLAGLSALIEARKISRPEASYTSELFDSGLDRIAQKLGEEAVETVIAAKNNSKDEFLNEGADLLYHFLVLCAEKNIAYADILQTLSDRGHQSGVK